MTGAPPVARAFDAGASSGDLDVVDVEPEPRGDAAAGTALARWWRRSGTFGRMLAVVAALVVGVNALLVGLDAAIGGEPGGPDGSSYATGASGVAAWAEVLARRDVEVDRLRAPIADSDLPSGATVVLVEPATTPSEADLAVLGAHLRGGGRLVAVGRAASDAVTALTGVDLGWSTGGGDAAVEPGALGGARTLRPGGFGRFVAPGPGDVLAADDEAAAVVALGPVVAVADLSVVSNQGIGEADNAAAAIALVGDGPVVFVEDLHGYGEVSGLAALPTPWKRAGLAFAVVALLGLWSAGTRLGPPERPRRALAPPRRAYVTAVAAALSRTGSPPPEEAPRGPIRP
mgnify:CR=1 FL=1